MTTQLREQTLNVEPSMRSRLATLEGARQLHRIHTKVDWDQEIGVIAKVNLSQGGPALLFENIKDHASAHCTKLLTCGIEKREQIALMLGLLEETSSSDDINEKFFHGNAERILDL